MERRVVRFEVIKEKIIKTDQLIHIVTESTSKFKKISNLHRELKLKYEETLGNLSRYKLENENLTFSQASTNAKQQLLEQEKAELSLQHSLLEKQYNKHVTESMSNILELQRELQVFKEMKGVVESPTKPNAKCKKPSNCCCLKEENKECNKCRKAVDMLKRDNELLSKKIKDMKAEYSVLVDKLRVSDCNEEELNKLKSELKLMKSSASVKVDEIESLRQQMLSLYKFKIEVEANKWENDNLKMQLERSRKELSELRESGKLYQPRDVQVQTDFESTQVEHLDIETELVEDILRDMTSCRSLLSPLSDITNECQDTAELDMQIPVIIVTPSTPLEKRITLFPNNAEDTANLLQNHSIQSDKCVEDRQETQSGRVNNPAEFVCNGTRTNPIKQEKNSKQYRRKKFKYKMQQQHLRKQNMLYKRRLKKKKQRGMRVHAGDSILNALLTLKRSKINFTISNESTLPSHLSGYDWLNNYVFTRPSYVPPPVEVQKPPMFKKRVTQILDCNTKKCDTFYMLLNSPKSDAELVGFFKIKDEIASPANSRLDYTCDTKPNDNKFGDIPDHFIDKIAEKVIKRIHKDKPTETPKRKRTKSTHTDHLDSFGSETEPELTRLFQKPNCDILKRNKMLLETAKLQAGCSNSADNLFENCNSDSNFYSNNARSQEDSEDSCSQQSFEPPRCPELLSPMSISTVTDSPNVRYNRQAFNGNNFSQVVKCLSSSINPDISACISEYLTNEYQMAEDINTLMNRFDTSQSESLTDEKQLVEDVLPLDRFENSRSENLTAKSDDNQLEICPQSPLLNSHYLISTGKPRPLVSNIAAITSEYPLLKNESATSRAKKTYAAVVPGREDSNAQLVEDVPECPQSPDLHETQENLELKVIPLEKTIQISEVKDEIDFGVLLLDEPIKEISNGNMDDNYTSKSDSFCKNKLVDDISMLLSTLDSMPSASHVEPPLEMYNESKYPNFDLTGHPSKFTQNLDFQDEGTAKTLPKNEAEFSTANLVNIHNASKTKSHTPAVDLDEDDVPLSELANRLTIANEKTEDIPECSRPLVLCETQGFDNAKVVPLDERAETSELKDGVTVCLNFGVLPLGTSIGSLKAAKFSDGEGRTLYEPIRRANKTRKRNRKATDSNSEDEDNPVQTNSNEDCMRRLGNLKIDNKIGTVKCIPAKNEDAEEVDKLAGRPKVPKRETVNDQTQMPVKTSSVRKLTTNKTGEKKGNFCYSRPRKKRPKIMSSVLKQMRGKRDMFRQNVALCCDERISDCDITAIPMKEHGENAADSFQEKLHLGKCDMKVEESLRKVRPKAKTNSKINVLQDFLISSSCSSPIDMLQRPLLHRTSSTEQRSITLSGGGGDLRCTKVVKPIPRPSANSSDVLSRIMSEMDRDKSHVAVKPKPLAAAVHQSGVKRIEDRLWRESMLDIAEVIYNKVDIEEDLDPYWYKNDGREHCSRGHKRVNLTKQQHFLLRKLFECPVAQEIPDAVIVEFKRMSVEAIIDIIIFKVATACKDPLLLDSCPSPIMTKMQSQFLNLMHRLEMENVKDVMSRFLAEVEFQLFQRGCNLRAVVAIARLYTAVCRLRGDLPRLRVFCCKAFLHLRTLCVPLFFAVLTSWLEVMPKEADWQNFPPSKVLVQVIHMKIIKKRAWNLFPLKTFLSQYYGYPKERWDCDEFFKELYQRYLREPSPSSDFGLNIFCRNQPAECLYEKINIYFKPLIYKIPAENVNFKATVILMMAKLCKNFKPTKELEEKYLVELRRWFLGLIDDDVPELIKQSVLLSVESLPKKNINNLPKNITNGLMKIPPNNLPKATKKKQNKAKKKLRAKLNKLRVNNIQ